MSKKIGRGWGRGGKYSINGGKIYLGNVTTSMPRLNKIGASEVTN